MIGVLEGKEETLMEQLRSVRDQLLEFRTELAQMKVRPVTVSWDMRNRRIAENALKRMEGYLESHPGEKVSEIADAMDVSEQRARNLLLKLEEDGRAVRAGIKRGTTWWPAEHPDMPEVRSDMRDLRSVIRDKAREMDVFTFQEIREQLPTVSDMTIRRWLGEYEKEGVLYAERVGTSKLYEWQKAEGPQVNRNQQRTPEQQAVGARVGGGQISGTGRVNIGSPVVNALVREASQYGVQIRTTKHKVEYIIGGKVVASSSKTPGASHLGGTRQKLRKAGVPVAP